MAKNFCHFYIMEIAYNNYALLLLTVLCFSENESELIFKYLYFKSFACYLSLQHKRLSCVKTFWVRLCWKMSNFAMHISNYSWQYHKCNRPEIYVATLLFFSRTSRKYCVVNDFRQKPVFVKLIFSSHCKQHMIVVRQNIRSTIMLKPVKLSNENIFKI